MRLAGVAWRAPEPPDVERRPRKGECDDARRAERPALPPLALPTGPAPPLLVRRRNGLHAARGVSRDACRAGLGWTHGRLSSPGGKRGRCVRAALLRASDRPPGAALRMAECCCAGHRLQ